MVCELIAAGSISFETALGLTVPQLEALYVARTRVLAAQRADLADAVAAAIGGSFGDESHRALQGYIDRLRAVSEGRDPEQASSYTEGAVVL